MRTLRSTRSSFSRSSSQQRKLWMGARPAIESLEGRTLLTSVVVNTVLDIATPPAGTVSLRSAISVANTSTTPTMITFDSTVFATPQTIVLNGNALGVSNSTHLITITGPAAPLTISGNNASDVFGVNGIASFSKLTVTKGDHNGIYNGGNLTLNNVTVSGNTTSSFGGGIYNNYGTITLTNVAISGNTASSSGGGFYNAYGTATLTNVTISGNTTNRNGGGIYNSGTATLTNVTISGNSAPAYSGDGGGGIYNDFGGMMTLKNVTVSGNSALAYGGGLLNIGAGEVSITNSIVAGNSSSSGGPDVSASYAVNSLGYNLIGKTDGSSGWNAADIKGTIASPKNALLGALANNGGPTLTMLPLAGSPAIDKGNNAYIPAGITKDQRGYARIANTTVDIGAVEVQPASAAPEVSVLFGTTGITDGDTTPSTTDGTDFGSGAAGASVSKTFTVKNTGTATLNTSNLKITQLDGTATGVFTITEPLAATIAPGGSDTFTVKFSHTAAGIYERLLSFANNDSNENPYNFRIKANVTAASTAPEVGVLGNSIVITDGDTTPSTSDHSDFGSTTPGGILTRTFAVKNTGTATLNTSNLKITQLDGTATGVFTITEPLAATIAAGGSDTFTVKFSYATAGTYERLLSFANNDSNENPYDFRIKGAVTSTLGSIAGTLFHDFNGNGAQDSGESPLGGWTVFLDADKDGIFDATEKSMLTNPNGLYTFSSLANATYRVRHVIKSGWLASAPSAGYYDVAVAGNTTSGKNFGDARPVTISGNVFKDSNGDGFKDTTETGLSAWKVFIDADNDGILDAGEKTATSDASGNFSFTGLKPGTFSVRLIVNSGFVATTSPAGIALRSGMTGSGLGFGARTA